MTTIRPMLQHLCIFTYILSNGIFLNCKLFCNFTRSSYWDFPLTELHHKINKIFLFDKFFFSVFDFLQVYKEFLRLHIRRTL